MPRKVFARRQLQIGIVLVVAQQDVVLGPTLLDEIVFERERLHDRVGDDDLDRRNLFQERIVPRTETGRRQVAAHTIPQRTRLADVDRLAGRVAPQIHARLLGQPRDLDPCKDEGWTIAMP